MIEQDAVYLGDGLYAKFDGYQFELFAYDGISKMNQLFLEPSVYYAFINFAENILEMG